MGGMVAMRKGLVLAALAGLVLFFACTVAGSAETPNNADSGTAWIFDSTLDMPFAMAALPPGFSAEGNVAWSYAPPIAACALWLRFAYPDRQVIVEIAFPFAAFREDWGDSDSTLQLNAARALRTLVYPVVETVSPDAEVGEIRETSDSLWLEATMIDLTKRGLPFLAGGHPVSEGKTDAAEMIVVFGTHYTLFSVSIWPFPSEQEEGRRAVIHGKRAGLLCVTAPAGIDFPVTEAVKLMDGVHINPLWRDQAEKKLAKLLEIEESPPVNVEEEKERWDVMNQSGKVMVSPAGTPTHAMPQGEYAPVSPSGAVAISPSGRYTWVNAAIDGCFLGFDATVETVDIENINPLVLFPRISAEDERK